MECFNRGHFYEGLVHVCSIGTDEVEGAFTYINQVEIPIEVFDKILEFISKADILSDRKNLILSHIALHFLEKGDLKRTEKLAKLLTGTDHARNVYMRLINHLIGSWEPKKILQLIHASNDNQVRFDGTYVLAIAHIARSKFNKAIETVSTYHHPNKNFLLFEIGKLCVTAGRLDFALRIVKMFSRGNVFHSKLRLIIVKRHLEIGNFRAAMGIAKSIPIGAEREAANNEIQRYLRDRCNKLIQKQLLSDAFELVGLLDTPSDKYHYYVQLAEQFLRNECIGKAIECADQCIDYGFAHSIVNRLVTFYISLKKAEEAESLLDSFIFQLQSNNPLELLYGMYSKEYDLVLSSYITTGKLDRAYEFLLNRPHASQSLVLSLSIYYLAGRQPEKAKIVAERLNDDDSLHITDSIPPSLPDEVKRLVSIRGNINVVAYKKFLRKKPSFLKWFS